MKPIARRDIAVLRPAIDSDLPAIDRIAIACWTPIFESFHDLLGDPIYREAYHDDTSWQQTKCRQIRDHFARQPDATWVVERDGEVIAFLTFQIRDRTGVIGNNGVSPDHAGQGWGTFMYRHLLAHFRAAGCTIAQVHTGLDRGHAAARRAYEAVGFDHQKRMVDYYQDLRALNPGSCPSEGEAVE